MNAQPPPQKTPNPPNLWFGAMGIAVVVAFAGLAVFDTSLTPHAAHASVADVAEAQPPEAATVAADNTQPALGTAEHPAPLYLTEAGAHTPEAKPARPPGPEATSLFDHH